MPTYIYITTDYEVSFTETIQTDGKKFMRKFIRMLSMIMVILGITSLLPACMFEDYDIYIFSDLSECQAIETSKSADATVTIHATPDKDKHIRNLTYRDFYACTYSSPKMQFTLFAYEFPDSETALKYYSRAANKSPDYPNDFSGSYGFLKFEKAVICDNFAYYIYGSPLDDKEVSNFLNSIFSKKLDFSKVYQGEDDPAAPRP